MACGAHGACSSHESDGLMSPSTNESSDGHPSQAAATAAHTCTRRHSAELCGTLRSSTHDVRRPVLRRRQAQLLRQLRVDAYSHLRARHVSTAVLKVFCGYPGGYSLGTLATHASTRVRLPPAPARARTAPANGNEVKARHGIARRGSAEPRRLTQRRTSGSGRCGGDPGCCSRVLWVLWVLCGTLGTVLLDGV
jgi:hypothetical protein